MANEGLSELEQSIVDRAVRRYRRGFYRWGHLVGWLGLPLLGLCFVPALKAYGEWIVFAFNLAVFTWYFVLSNRVIGKLAMQCGADGGMGEGALPGEGETSRRRLRFRPSVVAALALLPIAILMTLIETAGRPTGVGAFLGGVCSAEFACCLAVGFATAMSSFLVHLAGGSRELSSFLMALGIELGAGAFIIALVCGAVHGTN